MSTFPWRTLLFISVALNLLMIGAAAGGYAAGVRLERPSGEAVVERMPGPRAFLRALPPETRVVMRRELADSWAQSREARQAALQARRDAFAAAATEPYDAARVRAAFARLREADQTAIGVFHEDVIDAFARLTPEQRREALGAFRTAAPARREAIAPADDARRDGANQDAAAVAPATDPEARAARRQEMRERFRERRRERRELQQQGQQPAP